MKRRPCNAGQFVFIKYIYIYFHFLELESKKSILLLEPEIALILIDKQYFLKMHWKGDMITRSSLDYWNGRETEFSRVLKVLAWEKGN